MATNAPRKRQKPVLAFAGISMELPAMLPNSFTFDLAEAQGDEEMALEATYRAVVSVIGKENWKKLRDALSKSGSKDGGSEKLGEVLVAISKAYGLEAGE